MQNCKYSAYLATHLLWEETAKSVSEVEFCVSYRSVSYKEIFNVQIQYEVLLLWWWCFLLLLLFVCLFFGCFVFFFSDVAQNMHNKPKKSYTARQVLPIEFGCC